MFSSSYIVCSLRSAYYRPFSDFPQRMDGVRPAQLSVSLGRNRSYCRRFLRYDGSIPGPLPLICPSQRILNSCSALIKYRRVQTSLHRIIIRFESCLLSIILATLPFLHIFYAHYCLNYPKCTSMLCLHTQTRCDKICACRISPKIQEQVAGPCRNIGT